MNSDLLIKQFTINILVYLVTFKILNIKITSYRQWVKITSASVLTTITYAILKKYMAIPFLIIVSFILQNIFLSFFYKRKYIYIYYQSSSKCNNIYHLHIGYNNRNSSVDNT